MNIRIIRNKSKELYRENRLKNSKKTILNKTIIFLCFTFFIGILIGSIYFKYNLGCNFFEEKINLLEKINVEKLNIQAKDVFYQTLLKNILILMFFWIVGLSVVGVPILILFICYEGFSLSIATIYVLLALGLRTGYEYIYITMFLTTFINVISMILLCNSAIRVAINVLKQRSDIKTEFVRHSFICLLALIIFIMSSFLEAFITNYYIKHFIVL